MLVPGGRSRIGGPAHSTPPHRSDGAMGDKPWRSRAARETASSDLTSASHAAPAATWDTGDPDLRIFVKRNYAARPGAGQTLSTPALPVAKKNARAHKVAA